MTDFADDYSKNLLSLLEFLPNDWCNHNGYANIGINKKYILKRLCTEATENNLQK